MAGSSCPEQHSWSGVGVPREAPQGRGGLPVPRVPLLLFPLVLLNTSLCRFCGIPHSAVSAALSQPRPLGVVF